MLLNERLSQDCIRSLFDKDKQDAFKDVLVDIEPSEKEGYFSIGFVLHGNLIEERCNCPKWLLERYTITEQEKADFLASEGVDGMRQSEQLHDFVAHVENSVTKEEWQPVMDYLQEKEKQLRSQQQAKKCKGAERE